MLVEAYNRAWGSGKLLLEEKIKVFMKRGLTREEAIIRIAMKEGLSGRKAYERTSMADYW
mgnify:CR=1 FL=1